MDVFIIMIVILVMISIIVAYSNLHISFKTVFIPAIIFGSISSFLMLHEYLGKPVIIDTISREVIIYGQIIDKENEKIYLLLSEKDEPIPADYVQTVYNKKLAKALSEGQAATGGKPFILKSNGDGEEGEGETGAADKRPKGQKNGKKASISKESTSFSIHKLPPLKMPDKNL